MQSARGLARSSERTIRARLRGLAELEGYLAEVRAAEGWERSERTLTTGVAYHRMMLRMLEGARDAGVA